MSVYEIDADACWDALCEQELPERSLDMVGWFIDQVREDSAFLWVDEPWAEVDYADLETDQPVGLVVFAAPVEVDGPLVLSAESLVGDASMRDARAFVFLDEVRCDSVVTLSDHVALFAGGLVATNAACFAAPDASTHVGRHFETDFLISGAGDGTVSFWPETRLSIGAFDGAFGGTAEAEEVLTFDAETITDDSVSSVVSNLVDGHTKVPKSYRFPTRVTRKVAKPKKSKAKAERLGADAFFDALETETSDEVHRLLAGNRNQLFRADDFALRVPGLAALDSFMAKAPLRGERPAGWSPWLEAPTVVVVTDPVVTAKTLQLRDLSNGDAAWAYVFLGEVHCLDLTVGYQGIVVFAGGLNARIVSTARSDCHLHVEKHFECAVQSGMLNVAPGTHLAVGAWTGWVASRANTYEAFPHLVDDFEDDGVWRTLAAEDSLAPILPPGARRS
ncbi:MAG: hypothetical protein JJ863_26725 [Deltaproteobacteria bacterium]|nr:hypothetical protein [Deltaproteobacteria bacterium]